MVALHGNVYIFDTLEAFMPEMFEIIHINSCAAFLPQLVGTLTMIKRSQMCKLLKWSIKIAFFLYIAYGVLLIGL